MSPLNRGSLLGSKAPPASARLLPPPRFGIMPPGTPPRMLPSMNPIFGGHMPMRHRLPPPSRLLGGMCRPNGMLPLFPGGPRARGMASIMPPMPVGSGPLRGPPMRPWLRRMPSPQVPQMPHVRRKFNAGNGNVKGKAINNKKVNKLEELELKKPWMTDEIRSEIQKKNKLYAKAKKNKDAVEWEEFKDVRNKVTRMIRDAKNEYFAKHPEQAHLYPDDEDQKEENNICSDEDPTYCEEVRDKDFSSEDVSDYEDNHICGVDGCTYTANFLLVEQHLRMVHNKDLLSGNKNVSTMFIKWIMQRRRNLLQMGKVKKTKELEKLERGEIIKQVRNVPKKKITTTCDKKYKFRKRSIREIDNACTIDTYRGLHVFSGIEEEDEEEEENQMCLDKEIKQTDLCEKAICVVSDEDDNISQLVISKSMNSCTSVPILVDYEDETDDDEVPEEISIKRVLDIQNNKTKDVINEEISAQVQEETSDALQISVPATNTHYTDINAKSNKKSQNAVVTCQDKQKNEKETKKEKTINNKKKEKILLKYHNKFLENLLSRDIQHERNVICQCMKHIIDNNFFDLDTFL